MKHLLDEYNDITKNNRLKDYVVIGMILLMGVMIVSYTIFVYKTKSLLETNRPILDADGTPRKMSFISARQAEEIEAKNQILYFISNFYDFDKWNVEDHINNALWIGDKSVKELYLRFQKKGWYSDIIRLGIRQEAIVNHKDIQIDLSREPYFCRVPIQINMREEMQCEKFQVTIEFYLKRVSETFATNPHGFVLENLTQSDFKEIKE
ncbi:MAG: hypothetical protein Q8907_00035 [Bacteroidota bacterium]|nr:hypothetical protein [Bacteroidota bacterium]MDP4272650.1 hypothetical protein [Bacteroidota bacterium]